MVIGIGGAKCAGDRTDAGSADILGLLGGNGPDRSDRSTRRRWI
jgi:hypothetical protein